jgi:hypothetical protein
VFWYTRYGRFVGCGFEFLAGMKGHDAAHWNVHLHAGLWVAAGPRDLVAELEISEPCKFDRLAAFERISDFVEEGLHHILHFALIQTDVFEHELDNS